MEIEKKEEVKSYRSILKKPSVKLGDTSGNKSKNAFFNEKEILEYDKTRGQKMKIDIEMDIQVVSTIVVQH